MNPASPRSRPDRRAVLEDALRRAARDVESADPEAEARAASILRAVADTPRPAASPRRWPWLIPAVALPLLALAVMQRRETPPPAPAPELATAVPAPVTPWATVATPRPVSPVNWLAADPLAAERQNLAHDAQRTLARLSKALPL